MPGEITNLLEAWKAGNAEAGDEVIARTYDELRRVAHAYLRRERHAHTLQATALLHDAYMRLLRKGPGTVDTREAFFRLMAAEMRRRLVDHARRRLAAKRGGGAIHEPLAESTCGPAAEDCEDIEATLRRLDRALEDLSGSFPRAAQVVQLRFIAGLTTDETAAELGLSPGTVKRDWTFARAWLVAALESRLANDGHVLAFSALGRPRWPTQAGPLPTRECLGQMLPARLDGDSPRQAGTHL